MHFTCIVMRSLLDLISNIHNDLEEYQSIHMFVLVYMEQIK